MAKIGQILWNVGNLDGTYTSTAPTDIYTNLVGTGTQWSRLSIQAPPGTRFIIKQSNAVDESGSAAEQEIMVGRTGIYELPPGVAITYLQFKRPENIIKDEVATAAALAEGQNILYEAEEARLEALSTTEETNGETVYTVDTGSITLNVDMKPPLDENNNPIKPSDDSLWEKYINAINAYNTEYLKGIFYYNQGVQGVYKKEDNENNKLDLVNVIVDYVQEES